MTNTNCRLIIHGGAGSLEGQIDRRIDFHQSLTGIISETWKILLKENSDSAVMQGIRMLEDDPIFNAGLGSRIQADGEIRMSAAYMDGKTGTFSGVINVQGIQHPIDLAKELSFEQYKALAGTEATKFARKLGYLEFNPETEARRQEYERRFIGKSGTVGIIALDKYGELVVGTSTGGVGNEIPGRVSDTPTVAGNYASRKAAVSATGTGEEIVNLAVASRLVALVDSGFSLREASEAVVDLGRSKSYQFGFIALDAEGNMIAHKTCDEVFYAFTDGDNTRTFFEDAL